MREVGGLGGYATIATNFWKSLWNQENLFKFIWNEVFCFLGFFFPFLLSRPESNVGQRDEVGSL